MCIIHFQIQDSLSLEKLNLTGNNIGGIGALHMARMLIDNDYISELVGLELGLLHTQAGKYQIYQSRIQRCFMPSSVKIGPIFLCIPYHMFLLPQ